MRLIFDFDGTITRSDTIGTLASGAVKFQKSRHGQDLAEPWDHVVQAYVDDLQRYKSEYPIKQKDRQTVKEEVEFLAGLKTVEADSLRRVKESGVFSELGHTDLYQMGVHAVETNAVRIRDGFKELVDLAGQQGWVTGIISVNWSRSFIRGVLHQHSIPVFANEFSHDGEIQGPEFLGHPLTNSAGKLAVLDHEFAPRQGEDGKTVYFGDSPTDLECLLRGGIILSADEHESALIETVQRLGFSLAHVGTHSAGHDGKKANFYWAKNFREILDSSVLQDPEHSFAPTSNGA